MKYNAFIRTIVNSKTEQWLYDDDVGRYVFKEDIRITMKQNREDDTEFHESWVKKFIHHPTATRMIVDLCYNGNTIDTFYTASVDEARMYIPYPNGDLEITYNDYRIGRIINIATCSVMDKYDEYLKIAGIKVQEREKNIEFLK